MAVVGIDLGTTNTVIASVRDGRASALKDKLGRALLPSVVSFSPSGKAKIGYEAKDRRTIDPENTVFSVKRLIGRTFDSEHVQKAITRLPFELKEGPGKSTLVSCYGSDYTLPEISAMVLEQAQKIAEARLGGEVSDAVITVPANFNDLQRAATKVAGRTAGLEVLRIINEPTAAALAYGFGKTGRERIAVYDFGGGTFDVTLLDLSENVFEVLATAGDTFLGGDDIDMAIMDLMAEDLLKKHKVDAEGDNLVREQLRAAAEKLKIELSTRSMGKTKIEELEFEFTLRRSEFEKLCEPLLARTLKVCQEAMEVAGISNRDLDQVLMVGGSTRIPLVRRRISSFFGKMPQSRINPDEVVAIGAAIQASSLEAKQEAGGSIPAAPRPRGGKSQHPSRAPAPLGRPSGTTQTGLAGLKSSVSGTASEAPSARKRGTLTGLKSVPPATPGQKLSPAKTLAGVGPAGTPSSPPVAGLGEPRAPHKTLAGVGEEGGRAKLQTLSGVGGDDARAKTKTLAGLSDRPKGQTNLGLGASPSSPPPVTGKAPPSVRGDEDLSFDDETSVNEGAALVAAELDARAGRTKFDTIPGAAAPPDDDGDDTTDGSVTFDLAELEAMGDASGFEDLNDEATQVVDPKKLAARAAALDSEADLPARAADPADEADLPALSTNEPEELGGSALIAFEEVDLPSPTAALPATIEEEAEELGGSALIDLAEEEAKDAEDELDLPSPVAELPMNKTQVGLPARAAGLPGRAAGLPAPKAELPDMIADEAGLPVVGGLMPDAPRRTASAEIKLGLGQTQIAAPSPGRGPDFGAARDTAPSVEDLDELSVAALLPDDESFGEELDLSSAGLDSLSDGLGASTQSLGSRAPALPSGGATQSSGSDAQAVGTSPGMLDLGLGDAGTAEPAQTFEDSVVEAISQAPPAAPRPASRGPLLLDVTPLSLGVEVIGGYVDTLIERNSPIPCEMTRTFATAQDNQPMVRVRVSQGDEERFARNTLLGEVELTGLSQGPRGSVKVDVSFSLDESGMLQVSARDKATGHAADARLMLVGVAKDAQ